MPSRPRADRSRSRAGREGAAPPAALRPEELASRAAAGLGAFLPGQRWFGAKTRTITSVSALDEVAVPGSDDILALFTVAYAEGDFLLGNALFWLERYHVDGLRVDAVASMLYLDYSRRPGEWVPNRFGGNENLEAVGFLKRFNEVVYAYHPSAMTIAEESTSWPMVSRPTYLGGLGFGFKWNMGWMHDTLDYLRRDPVHRRYHHNQLTFGMVYAWRENFVLPLSHDEVVHGKGSLYRKMPGDDWQRFANLRAYCGFMHGHPGKKLLFMGGEFGQVREWNHDQSLDWHLLDLGPCHRGLQRLVRDLNRVYRTEPTRHQVDDGPAGFEWIDGRAWSPSSAGRGVTRSAWPWSVTSPRCRATATGRASLAPATTASSSTRTRPCTAGRTSGMPAARGPSRSPGRAGRTRSS